MDLINDKDKRTSCDYMNKPKKVDNNDNNYTTLEEFEPEDFKRDKITNIDLYLMQTDPLFYNSSHNNRSSGLNKNRNNYKNNKANSNSDK